MHIVSRTFAELSSYELHEILRIRQEVFIVEQQCLYVDADAFDLSATHILGRDTRGTLAAYARWLPPGTRFATEASFGRVLAAPGMRKMGYGRQIVSFTLAEYGCFPTRIHAQAYLSALYEEFGFVRVSEVFVEDGIPHLAMVRPADTAQRTKGVDSRIALGERPLGR